MNQILHKYGAHLLSFLGGLLYASGFPSFMGDSTFVGPIIGISLMLFGLNLSNPKLLPLKQKILIVLAFCYGYYFLGYYWIPYTMKEFGGLSFPFNHILGLVFPLFIAPQFLVFALFQHYLLPKFQFKTRVQFIVLIAFLLVFLESIIPQQFPAHMGHPWLILAPYLGLAPVFGAKLFSFINYVLALMICDWFREKRFSIYLASIIVILVTLNIVSPLTRAKRGKPDTSTVNLRIVQANIGNYLKIQSEKKIATAMEEVISFYREQSLKPYRNRLDLIVWPETAFPKIIISDFAKQSDQYVHDVIKDIARKSRAELFFGGYDTVNRDESSYDFESEANTAFHFSDSGKFLNVYHKIQLIPFGETLPFGPLNKYLSKYVQNVSYFARGNRYTLFKTRAGHYFTSAICYEILFPSFMNKYLNEVHSPPQFIINLTNDSWYGDTAEPHQHKFLAHWRALELGIPIVRATNTGITSLLYSDGSESNQLGVGFKGTLDIRLFVDNYPKSTIYQKLGLMSLVILVVLLLLLDLMLYYWRSKSLPSKDHAS